MFYEDENGYWTLIIKDYDIETLETWLCNDPDDFIEKYCEE